MPTNIVSNADRMEAESLDGSRSRISIGTSTGSIIAGIMTAHMQANEAAACSHVCPHIGAQIADIIQRPAIGVPLIVAMYA